MEMMLDKKQIQVIFLFGFKMGRKAAEIAYNTNSEFGSGAATEGTAHSDSRSFANGKRALEMRVQ